MILWKKQITLFGERETITITPLTLLVLLVILLRIPSLFEPYWYGDEGIYLAVGEGLRHGLLLYRDIFDHKPPAIYALAAVAGSLFWFKFILLVWQAGTTILFWKLAENLFDKKLKPVLFSSFLFVLLTTLPLLEGTIANAELFILGPTLAALYLVSHPQKVTQTRVFIAGLLFSLSILFKVPAVFDLSTLVAFWVVSIKNFKAIQKVATDTLVLFLGVGIPLSISGFYFAANGALSQYLTTAWFDNFTYISLWGGESSTPILTAGGLPIRAGIAATLLLIVWIGKRFFSPAIRFVLIWLILSAFAALISARPYPHYLIQTVPPICLAFALLAFGKWKERFLPLPFLLLFFFAISYYGFSYYPVLPYYKNFIQFAFHQKTKDAYIHSFDPRMPQIYQLASALNMRTTDRDRVFVWGTAPEIYALSRRIPSGRYLTSFHISDFNGEEETLQAMQKNKPKYIVLLPDETRAFPGFSTFLQHNYLSIEKVGSAQLWKLIGASP